jgi:predicted N-acetyltransferase YhbS
VIHIREETQEAIPFIREINERAFGQHIEADIIDQLQKNCSDMLSLVVMQYD